MQHASKSLAEGAWRLLSSIWTPNGQNLSLVLTRLLWASTGKLAVQQTIVHAQGLALPHHAPMPPGNQFARGLRAAALHDASRCGTLAALAWGPLAPALDTTPLGGLYYAENLAPGAYA